MTTVFIFGTSGFARETRDVAWALGHKTVFVAATEAERDAFKAGDAILESEASSHAGAAFAIGIGDNAVRRKIAERYAGALDFITLIHPGASFGTGQREILEATRGTIVCAGVRFTNSIAVGDFGIFNLNATIGHDCTIGAFVNVSPGANISGNVAIGEGAWIGTNAAINQGNDARPLTIGARTVIGSGSVVVGDCEPDSIYVGIPARKR